MAVSRAEQDVGCDPQSEDGGSECSAEQRTRGAHRKGNSGERQENGSHRQNANRIEPFGGQAGDFFHRHDADEYQERGDVRERGVAGRQGPMIVRFAEGSGAFPSQPLRRAGAAGGRAFTTGISQVRSSGATGRAVRAASSRLSVAMNS